MQSVGHAAKRDDAERTPPANTPCYPLLVTNHFEKSAQCTCSTMHSTAERTRSWIGIRGSLQHEATTQLLAEQPRIEPNTPRPSTCSGMATQDPLNPTQS